MNVYFHLLIPQAVSGVGPYFWWNTAGPLDGGVHICILTRFSLYDGEWSFFDVPPFLLVEHYCTPRRWSADLHENRALLTGPSRDDSEGQFLDICSIPFGGTPHPFTLGFR